MKYGLAEKEIKLIKQVFSHHLEIEKVVIYGSRAKGNYRPASDIDLTLCGTQISLSLLLTIENELDDLLLPYKIDLSVLHKIQNSDLLEHINRVGVIF